MYCHYAHFIDEEIKTQRAKQFVLSITASSQASDQGSEVPYSILLITTLWGTLNSLMAQIHCEPSTNFNNKGDI